MGYYAQFERANDGDDDYIWIGEEPQGRSRTAHDHIIWFSVKEWPGIIAMVQRELTRAGEPTDQPGEE